MSKSNLHNICTANMRTGIIGKKHVIPAAGYQSNLHNICRAGVRTGIIGKKHVGPEAVYPIKFAQYLQGWREARNYWQKA
jgi:ribosome modulation factor